MTIYYLMSIKMTELPGIITVMVMMKKMTMTVTMTVAKRMISPIQWHIEHLKILNNKTITIPIIETINKEITTVAMQTTPF